MPIDPWGRWVRPLLLVTAGAAVLSLFFPWWAIRSEGGSRLDLWGGQWCLTSSPSRTSCYPFSGSPFSGSIPAPLASSLMLLEVLQIVAVVAFVLAAAAYLFPRMRTRMPRVPAVAAWMGTVVAWVAVVDAWFAIPGGNSLPFGASGIATFTGEFGAFDGSYGYAWGADGAWFLLLLAGGLGILALATMRTSARLVRSRSQAA